MSTVGLISSPSLRHRLHILWLVELVAWRLYIPIEWIYIMRFVWSSPRLYTTLCILSILLLLQNQFFGFLFSFLKPFICKHLWVNKDIKYVNNSIEIIPYISWVTNYCISYKCRSWRSRIFVFVFSLCFL